MLTIDGSYQEGGGQILRTSLALSLVTGTAFRIEKIRSGRTPPGLRRQHLAAVRAAAVVGGAVVTGDQVSSLELTFTPHGITPGRYTFAIGTAGSTTLVLQTLLPALLLAPRPSRLTIEGGTHNPAAPPYDFLERTFLPLLRRMGARVTSTLLRAGFFPAGGGTIEVTIEPPGPLAPIDLLDRGTMRRQTARALVARLPVSIAERELAVIAERLDWRGDALCVETVDSAGPGNVVMLEMESDSLTELVTAFGARGVRAERVAARAAQEARRYLAMDVAVGEHLADQLLLPLAVTKGGRYTTFTPSRHTLTNIAVIQRFLPVEISLSPLDRQRCRIDVRP